MTCNPRHRVRPAPRLELPAEEALTRSRAFLEVMRTRRTVRDFSDRPVPFELVGIDLGVQPATLTVPWLGCSGPDRRPGPQG
jgi:hypothetical protein